MAFITETELNCDIASNFALPDYITFLPPINSPGQKVRVLALVKSKVATIFDCKLRADLCTPLVVWLELSLPRRALLGGVYRPWSGLLEENHQLQTLIEKYAVATADAGVVLLMGDLNLDISRVP